MEHGAPVDYADVEGLTALGIAAIQNSVEKIDSLVNELGATINLDAFGTKLPQHLAAEEGSVQSLERLRYHGADLNMPVSSNGVTPLHYAVEQSQMHVIDFLLSLDDIDVNPSYCGYTPLSLAVEMLRCTTLYAGRRPLVKAHHL